MDYSNACLVFGFDLAARSWAPEIFQLAQVDPSRLAEVSPAGTIVGELSGAAAQELGLRAGTVVVNGGMDQSCGALGAGMTRPGLGVVVTGTVECVLIALEGPRLTPEFYASGYPCHLYLGADRFFTYGCNFTAGSILRWYRDTFGAEEVRAASAAGKSAYALIVDEQATDAPADLWVLPYFMGAGYPYMDPRAKGAIIGLTLGTTKGQIIMALLEGITYAMKANLEALEHLGGEVKTVAAIGGGSRSPVWVQLKADVIGKSVVTMHEEEAGCLGAALLAGVGTGRFSSLEEGVAAMVRVKDEYVPDPAKHLHHLEKFGSYSRLYPLLKDFYAAPRSGGS
jgi:xylulokinase